ncbi:HAD family hydrolase [Formosa sediminum]|uniref:HAD family hydrolase n=1 Tax=Formosa sediminum TaxID=2594004 RepID=A0A516GS06_9FLAO|nr:HAD family hydrolase [Formosa sediminum]QDO94299.1 HAD family hydrolase [Formosa sediminum]
MKKTSGAFAKCIDSESVIFCDMFDTLVHRDVHPNYVMRLWSKTIIRALGINVDIDTLYFIRKEVEHFLSDKFNLLHVEIEYSLVINEIYNRLVCSDLLYNISLAVFQDYFEKADIVVEKKVQFLNSNTITQLQVLKEKGHKIYCVSDFYTSKKVLKSLLEYHNILELFTDVFVSSECQKSKHSTNLYPYLINRLQLDSKTVVMIGDNYNHDILNAQKSNLQTLYIPNKNYSKTKLKYSKGSDIKDYKKVINGVYKRCNTKAAPGNSDYILFYYNYTERLYFKLKQCGVKNIFFLSREGLYLKKLFDYYQNYVVLNDQDLIKTHYLKTSRQASMLVSLKSIDTEQFYFLRHKYPKLSLKGFLNNFDFESEIVNAIIDDLGLNAIASDSIPNFLDSEVYLALKNNALFIKNYDLKRAEQKRYFDSYLKSFNVDFLTEGMHLADIGWGGTMQEKLFDYFKGKVHVYGYYLGIREVYNITPETKRYGLNFSVYPFASYSDHILRGNIELNEQLLSAPHGSTVSYDINLPNYSKEFHQEDEKRIYNDHILNIQTFMFEEFKTLLLQLDKICYSNDIVQEEMTNYALRVGLFTSKKNISEMIKISEGFYSNVGDFSKGLTIDTDRTKKDILVSVKAFLLTPEKLFRYLLRLKPYLYTKKKFVLLALFPSQIIYWYIKFNIGMRRLFLSNQFYLKYSFFNFRLK